MPRDGANIYHYPPGTPGAPNTTIASAPYNAYIADVEQDLNLPRPIVAGGTGATSPAGARDNLDAEVAAQVVTNYDAHTWEIGSFYSAIGATGAPPIGGVATNRFAGICYGVIDIVTPANSRLVVEARDLDDTSTPGLLYVREKIGTGAWSAWFGTGVLGGALAKGTHHPVGDTATVIPLTAVSASLIVALTAPRIWTVPGAVNYPAGWRIAIGDMVGGCSATNTITLALGTVGDGFVCAGLVALTMVLDWPGARVTLESDGTNRWYIAEFNKAPKTTTFTTGSGTYTPVFGCSRLTVEGKGGGGGGAGAMAAAAGGGGNTTFGSATGFGGGGANGTWGGAGGNASNGTYNYGGQGGQGGDNILATQLFAAGGIGGGEGGGGTSGSNDGYDAIAGSGGGGGGGGIGLNTAGNTGGGGASGGRFILNIRSPIAASYSYAVGGGGTGIPGVGGAPFKHPGNGKGGYLVVTEEYDR